MKFRSIVIAAALLGATASHAVEIFNDNFDTSAGGLNVTPTGWTVADGTVDVINVFCQSGQCVDLDGSTSDAGVLSRDFNLLGGVLYTLSFDLSGNQRGGTDDVVEILFGSESLTLFGLFPSAPYATYTLDFTPAADGIFTVSFANLGGDDVGAVLDNVSINAAVQAIPEPETYALMLFGLGAVGAMARRRRRTTV